MLEIIDAPASLVGAIFSEWTFPPELPPAPPPGWEDAVVVPEGVPEPATWAIMLVGIGGLGAALRARRLLVAA